MDFDFENTFPSIQVFSINANAIVEDAKTNTAIREKAIIKQNIEEYICDKASEMGCEIVVTVLVSDEAPYLPQAITLEGDISPYARNTLSKLIETDIGISPEEQQWNG